MGDKSVIVGVCACGSGNHESIITLCEYNEVFGEGEVGRE